MRKSKQVLTSIVVVAMMLTISLSVVVSYSPEVSAVTHGGILTYDKNGGTWDVPAGFGYDDPAVAIPHDAGDIVEVRFDPVPERAGYAFLGWDTDKNAVNPQYRVVNEYNSDTRDDVSHSTGRFFVIGWTDITLYAVWKAVSLNVINSTIPSTGVAAQNVAGASGTGVNNYVFGSFIINYVNDHYTYSVSTRGSGNAATTTTTSLAPGQNVIRFTGTFDDYKQIVVSSTAPYSSVDHLIILFDGAWMKRTSTSATSNTMSLLTVLGTSTVEVQAFGNNTFDHNGAYAAAFRLMPDTNFVFVGQGNSKITMHRSTATADSDGPAIGSQGASQQTPGNIQIETGMMDFFWNNTNDGMRASVIGGGGYHDTGTTGSNSGNIRIRGGAIDIVMSSPYMTGTGIGAGGGLTYGGNVDSIIISGGHIKISQFSTGQSLRGAAIGGGSKFSAGASNDANGDGGGISISGGTIQIYQRSTLSLRGAAIGGGGAETGYAGQAIRNGGINISGGDIQIERVAQGAYNIYSAAIGGGGTSGSYATGAIVNISGGTIQIREYTSTGSIIGAGIGGGGNGSGTASTSGSNNSHPVTVNISGGTIGVRMYATSSGHVYGEGIGGAASTDSAGQRAIVNIYGGSISVDRYHGSTTYESTQDIGTGGSSSSLVTIDGGSIWVSNNKVLPDPRDSQGNPLYKTVVNVGAGVVSSVFVKKPKFIDPEFGVPRYADFHIDSKNLNTNTLMGVTSSGSGSSERYHLDTGFTNATYRDSLYLYLPTATASQPNEISVESQLNGQVKYFTSYGSASTITAVDQTGS
ncbi:MAG: InlB B-repeat-containing protein, partial [Candidatus Methanoplasma sp.]|nr:InlB B-repeat-containing protein [Candidatus Methanoplasma sp.]